MDPVNPFYTPMRYRESRERPRRDTIHVTLDTEKFSKRDLKKWFGMPPAPMPEDNKTWRPKAIF